MAGLGNILRRFVGRLREQETQAPGQREFEESLGPQTYDPLDASIERVPAEAGSGLVGAAVEEPSLPGDPFRSPTQAVENPGLAFTAEPSANPVRESQGTLVADVVGATSVDVGQTGLSDDDALIEDPLTSNCPYCGLPNQRIGARCERCSQVVVRLPAWAQHRRRNWLLNRLSWKRIIFASIAALLVIFVIWVNYPFAPNPLILFKNIQSQITADSSAGVWTISGRDLRNSRNVQVGFPPPSGEVQWTSFISEPLNSEPVAQNPNIYVGSADGIFSLSQYDGQPREGWEGNTPGRITGAAAVVDTYLFFGSTDHTVNSWNALTGDAWWSFPAEDTVEVAPVVSDGLLYVGSGKGWLYALDAYNGAVIWQTQLDSNASAEVAVHDGKLFVGDDKGVFYILSARTGQEWFRYRTLKTIAGPPVISADGTRAYFPSSGQLYAVSAEEREVPGLYQFKKIWAQLWLWQVPGVPRPPGQQGGLWRFSPENPLQGIYSSPALVDDENESTLYVGAYDNSMFALNALDGTRRWTFEADNAIFASPIVVKDRLLFGDGSGNVYSLNRHDGTLDWKISASSAVKIPPIQSNDLLIVRTEDGTVYGIK